MAHKYAWTNALLRNFAFPAALSTWARTRLVSNVAGYKGYDSKAFLPNRTAGEPSKPASIQRDRREEKATEWPVLSTAQQATRAEKTGDWLASDRQVLVEFYHSTQGADWLKKDNWLTGPVHTWYGVTVTGGRVSELCLPENHLAGRLPAILGHLSALQSLLLPGNQLSEHIPESIGNLGALRCLDLTYNYLTGTIPASIGKLTALKELHLCNNQLEGSLPASIGNLSALRYLHASENQLSNHLPTRLGELSTLQSLDLSFNQLSGSIPDSLSQLSALRLLSLSGNDLSGCIPESLGKLADLQSLRLDYNQLSGGIPESIGQLTGLQRLSLSYNRLTGTIPSSLGQLTFLQQLILSSNQLSGSLPVNIGNLRSLQYFYLYDNQLEGSIPSSIGQLPALQRVDLSNNQFSSLPFFMARLDQCYVNRNQLTFESLEVNGHQFTKASDYAPQVGVGKATSLEIAPEQPLLLSAGVGGTHLRYQWTHNGMDIPGATHDTLTVTTVGSYGCKITHALLTGLTLYGRPVNGQVKDDSGTYMLS